MLITLSEPSLVLLIGASGSGKSTFARRHFRVTEVLSSDFCRALVCDDENDQTATDDAFDVLHLVLARRLKRRRTTVIDATNVQVTARQPLIAAAKKFDVPAAAIVFKLSEELCQRRNQQRAYRQVPPEAIQFQLAALSACIEDLPAEGFQSVYQISSPEEGDEVTVHRQIVYS